MLIKVLRLKELLKFFFCGALIVLFTLKPSVCVSGAVEGISLCGQSIIPSLFPFMVLSKYLVYSGGTHRLTALFGRPLSALTGIPASAVPAFILGLLGGYPTGAYSVSDLLRTKQISAETAAFLLPVCNCCSPLFIVGTVGGVFLKSTKTGIILYAVQIISMLICIRIFRKRLSAPVPAKKPYNFRKQDAPFVKSISEACISVLSVCGYIVFFSVVNHFIALLPFRSDLFSAVLSAVTEVSGGVYLISCLTLNPAFKHALISAMLGFSGICVLLQVSAPVCDTDISLKPYISGKLICAAVSFILTYIIFSFVGSP